MKQVRFMIILIALDKKLKRCQQIQIKKNYQNIEHC